MRQINPLHTSHVFALSQACPGNLSGVILTYELFTLKFELPLLSNSVMNLQLAILSISNCHVFSNFNLVIGHLTFVMDLRTRMHFLLVIQDLTQVG
jgi:hypothetical protein